MKIKKINKIKIKIKKNNIIIIEIFSISQYYFNKYFKSIQKILNKFKIHSINTYKSTFL